jgi:hypothetical protein
LQHLYWYLLVEQEVVLQQQQYLCWLKVSYQQQAIVALAQFSLRQQQHPKTIA